MRTSTRNFISASTNQLVKWGKILQYFQYFGIDLLLVGTFCNRNVSDAKLIIDLW